MASKRKSLCIDEKVLLIRAIETGEKISDVGRRFGFSRSTVSTIWKNKEKILQAEMEGKSSKKLKKPKYEDLDQAILAWFHRQRQNNMPISGPVVKAKAENIAEEFGLNSFKASEGWLGKFKQRHNINYGRISGEVRSVDTKKQRLKKLAPASTSKIIHKVRDDIPRRLSCTECLIVLDARELYRCVQCPLVVMCAHCGRSNKHLHHCVLRMPNIQVYNEVESLFENLIVMFNKKCGTSSDDGESTDSNTIEEPETKPFIDTSQPYAAEETSTGDETIIDTVEIKIEPDEKLSASPDPHLPASEIATTSKDQFKSNKRKTIQIITPSEINEKIKRLSEDETPDNNVLEEIKSEIDIEEHEFTYTVASEYELIPMDDADET